MFENTPNKTNKANIVLRSVKCREHALFGVLTLKKTMAVQKSLAIKAQYINYLRFSPIKACFLRTDVCEQSLVDIVYSVKNVEFLIHTSKDAILCESLSFSNVNLKIFSLLFSPRKMALISSPLSNRYFQIISSNWSWVPAHLHLISKVRFK